MTQNMQGQYPHFRPLMSFVRRTSRLDRRLQNAWDAYAETYLLDIQGEHELSVNANLYIDSEWVAQHWGVVGSSAVVTTQDEVADVSGSDRKPAINSDIDSDCVVTSCDRDSNTGGKADNGIFDVNGLRPYRPLVIEIGSGQGENIVAAAQAHPEMDFLAVEVYQPGVAHTLLLAGKHNLTNIRVAQVNAPDLFERIADNCVSEVWTFFPDPWPKMRHHKRRLVQDALADQVHRVLRQDGIWRIATDIEDYALHVHEVMDARSDFVNAGTRQVSLPTEHVGKGNAQEAVKLPHADFTESERFDGRILTNFEKKGLQAGRQIHDFTYVVC